MSGAYQGSLKPYYQGHGVTLFHGEALSILRDIRSGAAAGLVTDPPYSSGGMVRGDRMASTSDKYEQTGVVIQRADFSGDNRDQHSFHFWCALWLYEALRIAEPGAPCCVFTDWRQLPVTTDAIQAGGWVWRGIVPWDKGEGTRPQMGRFRAQAEYVVWGSNGPMPTERGVGVLPGVVRHPVLQADKFHLTGKPTAAMVDVLRIVRPTGLVLDPFAGSGTTLVACKLRGYPAIGVELSEENCEVAANRLEGRSMFSAADVAPSPEIPDLFAPAVQSADLIPEGSRCTDNGCPAARGCGA